MQHPENPAQDAGDHRWSTIVALAERLGTHAALGSHKLLTDDPLKRRLIDAHLHLYYAQIDRLTLHDRAAAREQLAHARRDLDAVLEQLPLVAQMQLQPLDRELQALLGGSAITNGSRIEAARLRYDFASADLHELEVAV